MKIESIERQSYAMQPFPGWTFIGVNMIADGKLITFVEIADKRGFKVLCARTRDDAREALVAMLTA